MEQISEVLTIFVIFALAVGTWLAYLRVLYRREKNARRRSDTD